MTSVQKSRNRVSGKCLFMGGQIQHFAKNWEKLTSDNTILNIVAGYKIEFDTIPEQTTIPNQMFTNAKESQMVAQEIDKLLCKGVIQKVHHTEGEFLSNVFLRLKKDGSYRLILNLKNLNQYVTYKHFKMETLASALQLIKPNCYLAVLDLKDAYYSVPIFKEHRKFLRFQFAGSLYEFTCLPNGLSSAPRVFTKLLKPPFAVLRKKGILLVVYIDDIILIADSKEALELALAETITMVTDLGFTINYAKSSLVPSQQACFLGFLINSVTMTVHMTPSKSANLIEACQSIIKKKSPTIREVASIVGTMVSSFPGVKYGPLFYRSLENDKTDALKGALGNLDAHMSLSGLALSDLEWWINCSNKDPQPILPLIPSSVLKCDSSLLGWGSILDDTTSTGGRWSSSESVNHINYLELKAILMGLQSLCGEMNSTSIKVLSDNQTAVAYIKNMGGTHSRPCNDITREIMLWCKSRDLTLVIAHLPGKLNIEADRASRVFNDDTEWCLDVDEFNQLVNLWGRPHIDLFASRLNHKLTPYVAWKPDPGAWAIDTFTLNWSSYPLSYCFPPFSLIGRVLQKIRMDKATVILIVPEWTSQFWYPMLLKLLDAPPYAIRHHAQTLTLPHNPGKIHPLYPKLRLIGCLLSGKG